MPVDKDYEQCKEIVEAVMEWIGMRWTPSMIKRELREYFGADLSFQTYNRLFKAAGAEIRRRYNIDPQYYKGVQVEFYESVIRNRFEKTKNKLTAAERLDRLFGLEQITGDDPELVARKIREEIKAMKESVLGEDDGENKNAGERQVDNERSKENSNSESEKEFIDETDILSSEVVKEIANLKDEDLKRFRKKKL